MFCTKCGNHNPEGAQKCSFCGAELNTDQYSYQTSEPVNQQSPYQQPNYQSYPQYPSEIPGKGLGIASLICGIVSLVLFCIIYISIPAAIAGLITGCMAKSKAKAVRQSNGVAVAGIVCSSIGIALCLIFYAIAIVGLIGAADSFSEFYEYGNSMLP